jgi:hypothetical protein
MSSKDKLWAVNIETPTDFNDLERLKEFIDSHWTVRVSGAYYFVMSAFERGQRLHRPGLDFYFWFKDPELAFEFSATWHGTEPKQV